VRCIQARSTEITLPEPADVVVSDLRGVLPLYEQHVPSIVDARRRFLKPGGKLIPKRDVVSVAVVETSDHYDRLVKPWKRFELNMDAAAQIVTNVWKRITLTANQLL